MARSRFLALTLLVGFALAACSSNSDGDPSRIGLKARVFEHIHGLGVAADGTLYVGTHNGLVKSAGDSDWVYASSDRNDYMSFTIEPQSGMMYRSGHPPTGGSLGFQHSEDGNVWHKISDVLSPPVDWHTMGIDYAEPQTLYGWDSSDRGLFVTTDGGKNWELLGLKVLGQPVLSVSGTAKAGVVLVGTPAGLARSEDRGESWEAVIESLTPGWVSAVAADPKNADHLMVFGETGMQVSDDGGLTWATATKGLPAGAQMGAIAISPADSKIAYAAGESSIYKTTDGGDTWELIRSGG
ncbi:MAG: YCF48-related protein [Actinomycetota bacterium]